MDSRRVSVMRIKGTVSRWLGHVGSGNVLDELMKISYIEDSGEHSSRFVPTIFYLSIY
jgi:hypothetical protein